MDVTSKLPMALRGFTRADQLRSSRNGELRVELSHDEHEGYCCSAPSFRQTIARSSRLRSGPPSRAFPPPGACHCSQPQPVPSGVTNPLSLSL